MRMVALTDEKIARLKVTGKRQEIVDPAVPGLAIHISGVGKKVFIFGTRYPGSPHFSRVEIGVVGHMTLDEARTKAKVWAGLIAKGIHPRKFEEEERRAAAQATVAAVIADYVASPVNRAKRSAAVVARRLNVEILPHWSEQPITSISRRDVIHLIERIVARPAPARAKNVFDDARGLFNFALDRDVYGLETSPFDRLKPAKLIGPPRARQRVLTDEELFAFWRATGRMGYPSGSIYRLLLLTGARHSEISDARWREIDIAKAQLVIPPERFKSNSAHIIPLSPIALELLGSLTKFNGGDYLFSSTNGMAPINGFSKPKSRLDSRMLLMLKALARKQGRDPNSVELPGFVIHDLRRTVRTRLASLRIPDHVAEMTIGHARKGLQRVYDQHSYLHEIRSALEAWANMLSQIVAPPTTHGSVVLFVKKAI
jgi:integrase